MNLLDNIGKKVANTYKTAAKASGEILEETKLRLAVVTEQGKIDELYEKLGAKVYKMFENGQSLGEEFELECNEIQAIKEKIDTMKGKISELRNIKLCPKCRDEIDLECKFCPSCGAKQEIIDPS